MQQNNEIEHINKEILQKKSESVSKWVNANRKNTSKSRTNIVKNILQNKIKQIKKKKC